MEKIKVNMTPNPLDVQTIHASQNDGEGREWGFELHNNGELIDTSDVTEQMVFKSYKGGTEELLPSSLMNGWVDLGNLNWVFQSSSGNMYADNAVGDRKNSLGYNAFCPKYQQVNEDTISGVGSLTQDKSFAFQYSFNGRIIVRDTSYTDATAFKESLQGVTLWYQKADSTPTTSPFIGDIRYPQGLLTDQEFTYRQSPTEEDGLAKITDIKGNTIVWNQQTNSSLYVTGTYSNVAVTKSTDETYLIANGTASATAYIRLFTTGTLPMISGHKYCCVVPSDSNVAYYDDSSPRQYSQQFSSFMFTSNGSPIRPYARIENGVTSTNRRISFMIFDLTRMGLDSLTVEEFTSLFPLSYYAYNQGSLLSFNGNGIKTVGFNQWDEEWENGGISVTTGKSEIRNTSIRSKNFIPIIADSTYYFKLPSATYPFFYDENKNYIGFHGNGNTVYNRTFVPSELTNSVSGGASFANAKYMKFRCDNGGTYEDNICLNFSSDKNGEYKPYITSTLSLLISTYFPNGMDGVGTAYDELSNSGYVKRMGQIDLGTLTYTYTQTSLRFEAQMPSNYKIPTSVSDRGNMICAKYSTNANPLLGNGQEGITGYQNSNKVFISDQSTTDPAVFKTMMSEVYLYYELATPTETSFTTASLVTENAEIPLSNEDGVLIGKCTEELSAEPGFHDAKIKLSDSDGTCYSNKIQLHVERSPQ